MAFDLWHNLLAEHDPKGLCCVALCRQIRTKAPSESSAAPQLASVVEVCAVPELAEECQNGAPVIHLISSPAIHPVKEAAHLQEEASQLPPGMTLEVVSLPRPGMPDLLQCYTYNLSCPEHPYALPLALLHTYLQVMVRSLCQTANAHA